LRRVGGNKAEMEICQKRITGQRKIPLKEGGLARDAPESRGKKLKIRRRHR